MKALEEEANYLEKVKEEGQINREIIYLMDEHIHRMRIAVTNRMQYRGLFILTLVKRSVYSLKKLVTSKSKHNLKKRMTKNKNIIQLKVDMSKAAIEYLKAHMTPEKEETYLLIIGEYNEMILKFKLAKTGVDSVHYMQVKREIQDKAFQAERDEIQNLFENGEITLEVTRKMRKQINIREAYWMEENSVHSH
ncbi:hypothetical protein [Psychrobacillus vulpis]|uniref:Uncharacterized protein n=1 Tax=Psychrobacillus vulpis TaxID=2325572 RepID=A0A544TS75_9BACI|nr:hypothetical protein [Psychrobacillus vulpis]TQR20294.1 hypothetical protein FG384_07575 [Psychrobacillus vulpis]